jgi:hypothetical protein
MIAHPTKRQLAARAYNRFRRATRFMGVNCCQHAVMVADDKCADVYFISRREYELYKKDYADMVGVRVFVNGKPDGWKTD